MRLLVFILLFSFSIGSQAQQVCSAVYKFNSPREWRKQSDVLFKKYLVGQSDKGEHELYFTWSMTHPLKLEKVDEMTYRLAPKGSRRIVYRNHHDENAESPLEAVNTMFGGKAHDNGTFFGPLYQNYDGRIDPQIVKLVGDVEKTVEKFADVRQELGFVASGYPEHGGQTYGTMRFFNGTYSHSQTPSIFPFEYAFALRGITLKISKRIWEIQQKNPNTLMFEIGKFSLEGPVAERERAKALLELFWVQHYIEMVPPDSIFFAHVASEAHLKLYQRRYGFRVAEEIIIPGDPPRKEYIIEATAGELRKAFAKIYPLPAADFTVLPIP